MVKIAVTGGLNSGKSTVCQILKEEFGAALFDSDKVVSFLLQPQSVIGQQTIELLGSDVVDGESFDTKAIASRVFEDASLLTAYEKILHKAVERELLLFFKEMEGRKKLIVAEVPLLFESGFEKHFDFVICVYADHNMRKMREKRFGADEFERRDALQLKLEKKMELAHFKLMNSGSMSNLKQEIKNIIEKL